MSDIKSDDLEVAEVAPTTGAVADDELDTIAGGSAKADIARGGAQPEIFRQ